MNKDGNCPRRDPYFPYAPSIAGPDTWGDDQTCSYCGSLDPEVLMARLEAGDIEIGPTDKNYKIYVRNSGGSAFKQSYRICPSGADCKGPKDCSHWVTRDVDSTKFYFQHLSPEQQQRFVDLINERKMKIGYPGHFYVLPFFCQRAD